MASAAHSKKTAVFKKGFPTLSRYASVDSGAFTRLTEAVAEDLLVGSQG